MGTILVGTASWTDRTLIDSGRFYPPEAKTPEARLRHYAAHFPLVEVDSSYYALPARQTAEAWAERTPAGFAFDVKEATRGDLGILRLHGHNQEMWTKKGLKSSAERFNYLYGAAELEALLPRVRALAERVDELHVLFNNCYEDNAQRNAIELEQLLG